jgi:hypothetical protein
LHGPRTAGAEGRHLQCKIANVSGIGFGLGHLFDQLPPKADLLCKLSVNVWQGTERLQLIIEDVADAVASPIAEVQTEKVA